MNPNCDKMMGEKKKPSRFWLLGKVERISRHW